MNPLVKFVVERAGLAWALAIILSLLVGSFASDKIRDQREQERLGLLQTDAERRSLELMSITLNGNLMGAIAVLGLIDDNIKQEAQGKLPANNPKVLPVLESIGRSYDADGVFVVAENGIIASSWDNAGKPSTKLNVKFRPYYQMAMQGMDNVYAAVSLARGDRSLYFAIPIYLEATNGTQAIGAVVARNSAMKLDHLLRDKSDLALLLSPQGVVYASNRKEWIGHLAGKPTPERMKAIRDLKQFGNMFENKEPAILPLEVTTGRHALDGKRFAVTTAKVGWNDPFGDWTLVLAEDLDRSVPLAQRFWIGAGITLALLVIGTLVLGMLRSQYRQTIANRQLEANSQAQESAAQRESAIAAATVRLQRAGTLADLARVFLEETHALFGVLQGVVYVREENHPEQLHLAGSFACADPLPATLMAGEGLLGQCAVERRSQLLPTVPEGFATIRSGLGETRPAAVWLAPVLMNENLIGVIELALLHVPDEAELKSCDELVNLLAMNIEIVLRRDEMEQQLVTLSMTEEKLDKLADMERFNRLAQGREQRILDLKREVNALTEAGGKPAPYATTLVETIEDHEFTPHPDYRTDIDDGKPLQLAELVDLNELQKLFAAFCESVGIAAAIIDLQANILASSRWQRACTDFHRVNPESCARCIESDTELALKLQDGEDYTMYRCKNGMTDCASPIIIEGQHLANVFIGQFHLAPPDLEFFRQQARQFGYDEAKYLQAVQEAPVADEKRLPVILGFLSGFARMISNMSLARRRADAAQIRLQEQAEMLKRERVAAMSLAEDEAQARLALEAIAKESRS